MRGKGDKFLTIFTTVRITPAYAGKRVISMFHTNALWDHPRLCGEKSTFFSSSSINLGSPPPMRGKVPKSLTCQIANRITPAYAGKSFQTFFCKVYIPGSPPPMRGKGHCGEKLSKRTRITPAYAGKSTHLSVSAFVCKDHPRLCGEKFL